jgi:hypothetical protein
VDLLQIFGDGGGIADGAAVFHHQHGRLAGMVEGQEAIAPFPGVLGLQLELQALFLQEDSQLAGGRLQTKMIQATHGRAVYSKRAAARNWFSRASAISLRPCTHCHCGRGPQTGEQSERKENARCKSA